jgi:uncharacterized protein (TIGR00369 family)
MNTDQVFLAEFMAGNRQPAPVLCNPLAAMLNAQLLEADASGRITMSFEPPETFIQGARVLQGGAVATMLDFAIAFAVLAALPADRSFATASLTTNFMKAAAPGKYIAHGTLERLGSQVAFGAASLQRADSHQTVATATAVMPIFPSVTRENHA